MTVDECANVIAKEIPGRWVVEGEGDKPPPKVPPAVRTALRALLYTESVRAAGVLRETANSDEVTSMCCSEDTGDLLDAIAEHLLDFSPGKVKQ